MDDLLVIFVPEKEVRLKMKIEEKIAQGVREAVKALYGADIDIKSAMPGATRKEFEGDYTVVVFPFLRASKQKPEATAQAIGEWLVRNVDVVTGFNVVKGFLNLTVDAAFGPCAQQSAGLFAVEDSGSRRQPGGEDEHCQRPRHTHLQVDAGMAEMGRRLHAGVDGQEGRPSDWRFLCIVRQALQGRGGRPDGSGHDGG